MTSGNVDDRDGARMLMSFLDEGGWCLADLGYRGASVSERNV